MPLKIVPSSTKGIPSTFGGTGNTEKAISKTAMKEGLVAGVYSSVFKASTRHDAESGVGGERRSSGAAEKGAHDVRRLHERLNIPDWGLCSQNITSRFTSGTVFS